MGGGCRRDGLRRRERRRVRDARRARAADDHAGHPLRDRRRLLLVGVARLTGQAHPGAARRRVAVAGRRGRRRAWSSSTSRWCAAPSTPSPRSSGSPSPGCRWCWPLRRAGARPVGSCSAPAVVTAGRSAGGGRGPHGPGRARLGGARPGLRGGLHAAGGAGAGQARPLGRGRALVLDRGGAAWARSGGSSRARRP